MVASTRVQKSGTNKSDENVDDGRIYHDDSNVKKNEGKKKDPYASDYMGIKVSLGVLLAWILIEIPSVWAEPEVPGYEERKK